MRQAKNNLAGLATELLGTLGYVALLFLTALLIAR
jgi:hypothetical protein